MESNRQIPQVKFSGRPDEWVTFLSVEADGYVAGGGVALVHQKGDDTSNARAIAEVPTMIETLKAWISAEDMPCMKGEEMVAYNEQYHRALKSAKDILKRIED